MVSQSYWTLLAIVVSVRSKEHTLTFGTLDINVGLYFDLRCCVTEPGTKEVV